MIKVLFLADIVGKIGRYAIAQHLPKLKAKYKPDIVIANAENLAHGIGFTLKTLDETRGYGVDFFTSGNHAWKKAGADDVLDDKGYPIVRPANYGGSKSGVGYKTIKIGKKSLTVVNLLGQVFIDDATENPFKTMEKLLKKAKGPVLVDFHGEATSEKTAFAAYFDGKVAAVLGTHTHVQTADERILPGGTAFICDAGMVGYEDSIIGANKDQILNLFIKGGKSSKKHDLPDHGKARLDGVYLEIDGKSGKAEKIERFSRIVEVKPV